MKHADKKITRQQKRWRKLKNIYYLASTGDLIMKWFYTEILKISKFVPLGSGGKRSRAAGRPFVFSYLERDQEEGLDRESSPQVFSFWGKLMVLQLFFLGRLELIWGTNGCMTKHIEFALQTMNMSCIEFFFSISWFITRLHEGGGSPQFITMLHRGVLQRILQYYIFTDLVGKVGM